ncbi:hypothetical protein [Halobaculum gomorrense]|uniref:hypothetical protein n=1 Tax=Halobaculum gomorrense TaxID=43928 RepID=UPI000A5F2A33|nr:hypothetical protein [Halobaculum gomorrense]
MSGKFSRGLDIVDYAVRGIVDNKGTDTVCEALEHRTHVREEVAELDRRLFGDVTADYRLARILDSIQRTAEHGGNIAERGLQRAIRRGNGILWTGMGPQSGGPTQPLQDHPSKTTDNKALN